MTLASRAPGKAFLSGEYAVLHGGPALVMAVDRYAIARIGRPRDPSPLLAAVARACEEHGAPIDVDVDTSAMMGPGGQKLGLGSSAAAAVAAVHLRVTAAGQHLTDDELFVLARRAHRAVQPKGSALDVLAAAVGGVVDATVDPESGLDWNPVTLPSGLSLVFAWTGASASTPSLVASAGAQAESLVPLAVELRAALLGGDARTGRAAVEAYREAMSALGRSTGTDIVTPAHARVAAISRDYGAAAKPSGAGGGDLAVAFVWDDPEAARALAAALGREGFTPIPLAVARTGAETMHESISGSMSLPAPVPMAAHASGDMAAPAPVRMPGGAVPSSRLAGFYKLSVHERRCVLAERLALCAADLAALEGGLDAETADHLIENVVGTFALPFGLALNFLVDGRDVIIPMAVEEPSIVAAASFAARTVREAGGFRTEVDPPEMIAQVELRSVPDLAEACRALEGARGAILDLADRAQPNLRLRGGGCRDVHVRVLDATTLCVHLVVDCRDAMGANLLNSMAEAVSGKLAVLARAEAGLRILSNLCDRRLVRVRCEVPAKLLGDAERDGQEVLEAIVAASRFAELDPYRAVTHNKGIHNGVDAVVVATGNDWRQVEAAAHAYAARRGRYAPLAVWTEEPKGVLVGALEMPLAVGVVGGALRVHRTAQLALRILGTQSSSELAAVCAAAGLATNLSALRALATEGIQRGHMGLHARSVARAAGAVGPEVDELAEELASSGDVKPERAAEILARLRAARS